MSVKIKPGVKFAVVAPAGFLILQAIKTTSKQLGLDLTITCGTDGKHIGGATDPHLTGEAIDVRSRDLKPEFKHVVLDAITRQLPQGRFYGVLEGMDGPNEHFHVQRSRGTTFTVEDFLAG